MQMLKIDTKSVTSEVYINNLMKCIKNDSYFYDKPALYTELENKSNNSNQVTQESSDSND
jgi:hypothetical protein